jgi:putative membrane protein
MSELKDPRVLFAAERTLLAWNRTSISIMAFGFVIERFGLFLEMSGREEVRIFQRQFSFVIGFSFILYASFLVLYSAFQHWRFLKSLTPAEIPPGYHVLSGMISNLIVGMLGLMLSAYLLHGFL